MVETSGEPLAVRAWGDISSLPDREKNAGPEGPAEMIREAKGLGDGATPRSPEPASNVRPRPRFVRCLTSPSCAPCWPTPGGRSGGGGWASREETMRLIIAAAAFTAL